ncbi:MAG: ATP-grasp domain-containing protein [Actinobacteria bacterium]|nr:ATP-grasp domain-containing protein [Actinomycetota bacterium]
MKLPDKVLVANRGEIAARIIRTLRALEVPSVAVFHALDRESPAVRDAGEAVELHGDTPVGAYLNAEAIIAAAVETGATAIHPGFGFLSENADFAQAVADAGIAFIGPPPDAIRAMGDKIESKAIAQKAGMPTVPGSDGAVSDADAALAAAEQVGYPVLLKASAGGGGKGMRIARSAEECREAFDLASSEAVASFGDGRVFVERYVDRPRHIEVQVLADSHGNVVHLGERECSIQRRYQKVIEEAPSSFIDPQTRAEMGARAVDLAKAVGYVSAGTIEMVVDGERNFYFLEMNTRLQVEHPVTELVTGKDIVAEQLRIAAGEELGYDQSAVELTGHAIECRIYAEDPAANFAPATGRLELVHFPAGPGVRVDHGTIEGQEVSASFDPMIAKVIGSGADRDDAIRRSREILRETVLLGLTTNAAYLERVLAHPAFASGDTTTSFLDEHVEELVAPPVTAEEARLLLAAAALASPRFDHRFEIPEPLAAMGEWRP